MVAASARLRRAWEKNAPELRALCLGRLPRFVYGGALGAAVPVFVYHDVGPELEEDLAALRGGGYRALSAEELERWLRGGASPGRSVVLTFDDGLVSLTSVAVPLLEAYGFRAIAFVVAGLVPERAARGLAGWAELRRAVEAGTLEVASHSLFHHQVPVSARVIGRVGERTDLSFTANVVVPRVVGDAAVPRGWPIFVGRPRYTGVAFRPDPDSVARWVAAGGRGRITGERETQAEADAAVIADIEASFALLRRHCPSAAAGHLAYPWYAGDARTDRLAQAAGARVVYGGIVPAGDGGSTSFPRRVQRLPPHYLWRLPGVRRRPLWRLVSRPLTSVLRGPR